MPETRTLPDPRINYVINGKFKGKSLLEENFARIVGTGITIDQIVTSFDLAPNTYFGGLVEQTHAVGKHRFRVGGSYMNMHPDNPFADTAALNFEMWFNVDTRTGERFGQLWNFRVKEQQKGTGQQMARIAADLLSAAGFRKCLLNAGDEVGGYFWASIGGEAQDQNAAQELQKALMRRVKRLEGDGHVLPPAVIGRIDGLTLPEGDPRKTYPKDIAELEEPRAKWNDKELPLGKALMLGLVWHVVFDFDNERQMSVFNLATGREACRAKS